jgi:hypothetical protein
MVHRAWCLAARSSWLMDCDRNTARVQCTCCVNTLLLGIQVLTGISMVTTLWSHCQCSHWEVGNAYDGQHALLYGREACVTAADTILPSEYFNKQKPEL